MHVHVQVSLGVQFIAQVKSVFSPFVFLLWYISRKEKFFIEGFFIEDYIQESKNLINCKIL